MQLFKQEPDRIIWHHTLCDRASVEEIDEWHRARGFECIGYHRVIQPDGTIEVGRSLKFAGAHALGRNRRSIGVALVGDFRYHEPSVQQLSGCARLYHALCTSYNRRLKMEFHRPGMLSFVERGHSWGHACPGEKLSREGFLEEVGRACPLEF